MHDFKNTVDCMKNKLLNTNNRNTYLLYNNRDNQEWRDFGFNEKPSFKQSSSILKIRSNNNHTIYTSNLLKITHEN